MILRVVGLVLWHRAGLLSVRLSALNSDGCGWKWAASVAAAAASPLRALRNWPWTNLAKSGSVIIFFTNFLNERGLDGLGNVFAVIIINVVGLGLNGNRPVRTSFFGLLGSTAWSHAREQFLEAGLGPNIIQPWIDSDPNDLQRALLNCQFEPMQRAALIARNGTKNCLIVRRKLRRLVGHFPHELVQLGFVPGEGINASQFEIPFAVLFSVPFRGRNRFGILFAQSVSLQKDEGGRREVRLKIKRFPALLDRLIVAAPHQENFRFGRSDDR